VVMVNTKQQVDLLNLGIIGLHGAGKTTFINTISQRTRRRGAKPHQWHYGQVDVDPTLTLQFTEPPSPARFDFFALRERVDSLNVSGYIVFVDSTKPQTFGEFISVLYTIRAYHDDVPVLVVANKQNHYRAWNVNDLRTMLRIQDDIPVMPCVATDFEIVKNTVIRMLYMIFDRS
jgi:signal recognition particle receptor subunit beta